MKIRILYTLNKVLLLISLLCYASVWVSPATFWIAGFFSLIIPIVLLFNVLYIIFWIIKKKYPRTLFSIFALVAGFNFIFLTFSFHILEEKTNGNNAFSVLSYNVKVLQVYEKNGNPKEMMKWLRLHEADIKCFQEFYHQPSSEVFNSLEKIIDRQRYPYHYFKKAYPNDVFGWLGMATFSRFPIVNKGFIDIDSRFEYGAIFTDLKINQDTVRVYNIHLKSMSINEAKIMDTERVQEDTKNLLRTLKRGFVSRAKQIEKINAHLSQCPYLVVLCGDLNEIPYSYAYTTLKKQLKNSFEDAGNGFGFSYNGRLFFLRIDNQFYSNGLRILRFKTLTDVDFSDHFPTEAFYAVE